MADDLTVPQSEQGLPEPAQSAVKKNKAALDSVQADIVQLNQSNANQVTANTVTIRNSGVRQVDGQTVTITDGGTGIVQGTNISVTNGNLGVCSASEANIQGDVGVMIGQSVALNNHRTGLIVSRDVTGGHIQSVIFLAGQSHAPVDTIVDQRSVALFGLATGISIGLVLSIFRLLKR
jgi:hypothetical protein